ncbi:hypothetical protein [Paracoccus versutus]
MANGGSKGEPWVFVPMIGWDVPANEWMVSSQPAALPAGARR